MNEIAKHKAAIEDAETQNKVCNLLVHPSAHTKCSNHLRCWNTNRNFATSRVIQCTCDSSVTKHFKMEDSYSHKSWAFIRKLYNLSNNLVVSRKIILIASSVLVINLENVHERLTGSGSRTNQWRIAPYVLFKFSAVFNKQLAQPLGSQSQTIILSTGRQAILSQ